MAIVYCGRGHYYDNEKYSQCPYCGLSVKMHADRNNAKVERPEDEGRTVAIQEEVRGGEETVSLENENAAPDDGKTVSFYSADKGNDYVTGWIVCVEGPEKGRDYRLFHGFNYIGRGNDMAICISEDMAISREKQCAIVYDDRSNTFSIVNSTGALTYLNDKALMEPCTLKTGDLIGIGRSKFEFVAFCREGRVWEKT